MEIGPIPGIRAVQPIRSTPASGDLSGVFRVDFQRQQQERYKSHQETSERGLEEEDQPAESDTPDGAPPSSGPDGSGERQISFFA